MIRRAASLDPALNASSVNIFLTEFGHLLEDMLTSPMELIIMGDFNIHCDRPDNHDTMAFTNFLESCGLKQHVQKQTHTCNRGHVLDLIITYSSLDIIKYVEVFDLTISDHFLVTCTLDVHKHTHKRTSLAYRKIKNIDVTRFAQDVTGSPFVDIATRDADSDVLADTYNTVLGNLLDKHAPLVTKTCTLRLNTSWYSGDLPSNKVKKKRPESR